MAKIISTEFGVCCKNKDGEESHGLIPVDTEVQKVLISMLNDTKKKIGKNSGRYEPAQKYGPEETLWMPRNDENLIKVSELYDMTNIDENLSLLKNIKALFYYFAVFNLEGGGKTIGVRRTTQFKGVMTAKNRLVRLCDDGMNMVKDDIFKLDTDFDFLVRSQKVLILRPASLVSVADLNEYVKKNAASALKSISGTVKFVSFDSIVKYVSKRVRAAKLVASLRARDDLHLISRKLFITQCCENNIPYNVREDGLIEPIEGKEVGFLQLLDRRRFTTELITGVPERYEAPNRRGVN